jgi:flagellar motor protein MotB
MAKKIVALLSLALCAAAAVGCSSGADLQGRIDELTREQEEMQRQKEALERDRNVRPSAAPAPVVTPVPADPDGMDIRRRGNDTVINIPSDLFFASGSATLNGGGERSMAKIAEYIRKNSGGGLIRVEGHSDSDPIRRTKGKFHCNWDLSFQRAHAVMHFLVDKGNVDQHRVVCEAFGDSQPQSTTDKSKNRRVEIVIAR